jgi:hypothetical protein
MCNNDRFIVAGGNPAPAICGTNNGNHSEYKATQFSLSASLTQKHCKQYSIVSTFLQSITFKVSRLVGYNVIFICI